MATTTRPAPREGGFSLVEVLIAVAILGIVALGIVGLFSHAIMVNASGYDYAQLSAVARQTVEQMQALPFADAALALTTTPRDWPDPTGTGKYAVHYWVNDYFVQHWTDVSGVTAWPTPNTGTVPPQTANIKRITLRIESTNLGNLESRGTLLGNRQFVMVALRAP